MSNKSMIFDLDVTLWDTSNEVKKVWQEMTFAQKLYFEKYLKTLTKTKGEQ